MIYFEYGINNVTYSVKSDTINYLKGMKQCE